MNTPSKAEAVDLEQGSSASRSGTRTGTRVRQLVDDVKADLADIENLLRQARDRAAQLEEEGRGINGLSAACRGWGQQLDKMLNDIDDEVEEVERTMLGARRPAPEIAEKVNDDLRKQIVLARGA